MNGFSSLSFLLLSCGLICIAASLRPALNIAQRTQHKGWWTLLTLMLLFVIGYVLVQYYFATHFIKPIISLLIAGIMGGGGIFVGLVIQLSLASIIKAQAQTEQEYYNARHDALTGLPNRAHYLEHLQGMIEASQKQQTSFAVLIADMDKFKEINDTLGHDVGDKLLQELGLRLNALRSDQINIARLGGDEFALTINAAEPAQIISQAKRIVATTRAPFLGEKYSLMVELSMGIAIYPEHEQRQEALMKYADIAMYNAKRNKQGIVIYNPQQDEHSVERLKILSQIHQALNKQEFKLFYQPLLRCSDASLVGFEALIRWVKPCGTIVLPGDFIPQIEQSQFMTTLSRWVIDTAISQLAQWQQQRADIKVSINLSAVDLQDDSLVEHIQSCLAKHQLKANNLCFELTESAIMEDQTQALISIDQIIALGAQIAVDDFGTGYSSLSLLRDLPISIVKIDRSFIQGILNNQDNYAIVKAVIDIAHKTQRYVVAEGIDSLAVEQALHQLNCDIAQGFLYSEPIEASQSHNWLQAKTQYSSG